jgi:hypothetical protein
LAAVYLLSLSALVSRAGRLAHPDIVMEAIDPGLHDDLAVRRVVGGPVLFQHDIARDIIRIAVSRVVVARENEAVLPAQPIVEEPSS